MAKLLRASSEAERAIIRRAPVLIVECERLEQAFALAEGAPTVVELDAYRRASNSLRRLRDPARLERADVPVDRLIAARMRFGCVLADASYGLSGPFRQGLTARSRVWAVGIPRHLKVYPVGVQLIWPIAARGRPRQRHIPDLLSIPAEDMRADATWRNHQLANRYQRKA